jgi:hypothetical protein
MPRRALRSLAHSAVAWSLLACHTTLNPFRAEQAECQEVSVTGRAYDVCDVPLDHASAATDCDLRGAHLLSVESAEEDRAVAAAIFEVTTSNVWLGGVRSDDLVWSWPDGSIFWRGGSDGKAEGDSFVLWQPGEPNNTNSSTGEPEACLALTGEGADWNDRACRLALPYVCEHD